jgi:TatD DNase family protein
MLFDTHAHLDDRRYDNDRVQIIENLNKAGVGLVMHATADLEEIPDAIRTAEKYPFIYASAGVHPHYADKMNEERFAALEAYLSHPKVKAVGEIGLDYHYKDTQRDAQQIWFERQMQLAADHRLPVIVHDREAHADCMKIVRKFNNKGVFHSYSGSAEMAKELLNLGWYISFSGVVTFKNARGLLDVVRSVPLDRILIETDCPYLSPEPHRGKRNEPAYVRFVAQKIAELKGLTFEEVAAATTENAKTLFGIT